MVYRFTKWYEKQSRGTKECEIASNVMFLDIKKTRLNVLVGLFFFPKDLEVKNLDHKIACLGLKTNTFKEDLLNLEVQKLHLKFATPSG